MMASRFEQRRESQDQRDLMRMLQLIRGDIKSFEARLIDRIDKMIKMEGTDEMLSHMTEMKKKEEKITTNKQNKRIDQELREQNLEQKSETLTQKMEMKKKEGKMAKKQNKGTDQEIRLAEEQKNELRDRNLDQKFKILIQMIELKDQNLKQKFGLEMVMIWLGAESIQAVRMIRMQNCFEFTWEDVLVTDIIWLVVEIGVEQNWLSDGIG